MRFSATKNFIMKKSWLHHLSVTAFFSQYIKTERETRSAELKMLLQVRTLFLQWIPWVLRMARPGEKITRKTIMMAKKMKELDIKETSSKSLLSNVLDMDDDFRRSTLPRITAAPQIPHPSHVKPSQNNQGILR